jgi:hypothetical protein
MKKPEKPPTKLPVTRTWLRRLAPADLRRVAAALPNSGLSYCCGCTSGNDSTKQPH